VSPGQDEGFPYEGSRVKELQAILNDETDVGAILRAQLILEEVLTDFLGLSLVNPTFIRRRSFSFKLDLLQALGLMTPGHKALLQRLLELRNRIAHTLQYLVTDSDLQELHDSLSPRAKASYAAAMAVSPDPARPGVRLRMLLVAIFIVIERFYSGGHSLQLDSLTKQFRSYLETWELDSP
jgi:hypothetical protein